MKKLNPIILCAIFGLLILLFDLAQMAYAGQERTSPQAAADATRACTLAPGNAIVVTAAVGASNATSALTVGDTYLVRCTTESYIATGATAPTAGTSNMPLPPGIWPFRAGHSGTTQVLYLAFRATSAAGTCYVQACN